MCNEIDNDSCVVGIWLDFESTQAMTYEEVKEASKESIYSMVDYTDLRKNTNLIHFRYCPYCGEQIPWNKYHKIEKEGSK